MKTYKDLISECLPKVKELMPWDLESLLIQNPQLLLVDVREPYEFNAMHIAESIHAPRGILESACDWDYEETIPQLVQAREREIVIVCRSGYRSVLAAAQMQQMGYQNVASLKTGLRGWSEYEQPLINDNGQEITEAEAELYFASRVRLDQQHPGRPRKNTNQEKP